MNAMKNHIIIDSACDLTSELIAGEDISMDCVPINLNVEGKLYVDDETLDIEAYLQLMDASKESVKTSAPSPESFLEKFKKGKNIFVVTLSSKLSATYQSAMLAKELYLEQYEEKFIHVFDSLTSSVGEAVIVMKIAELLKKGVGNTEVVEQINQFMKDSKTYLILDKFDNLVKTGRIKAHIAKLASVLNIKPICGSDGQGEIKMIGKARGFNRAVKQMVEMIGKNTPDLSERIVGITHVKCYEKAVAIKEEILRCLNVKDIVIQECRGVTATYGNRGGIVVAV
jgi:DegV family protein with EDD domain